MAVSTPTVEVCKTCRYFEQEQYDPTRSKLGVCHRLPPTPVTQIYTLDPQPTTIESGWCGEHKPIRLLEHELHDIEKLKPSEQTNAVYLDPNGNYVKAEANHAQDQLRTEAGRSDTGS